MADEEMEGVNADSPTASETSAPPATAAVTGSQGEPSETDAEGVPWKNRMAEMERRHQRAMEDQQRLFREQLQQTLQQFQPLARPQPQAQQEREYSDEELLALANQGHSAAMQTYVARQVQRQVAQQNQQAAVQMYQAQRARTAVEEINALQQQYPDLTVTSSELYRAANKEYGRFLPGRDQNDAILLAYQSAIANLQPQRRATETSRQSQVQAHESVGGTSYARQAPRRGETGFVKSVSPQEAALAAKLNVKDPLKAKQRFAERQQAGRSTVSPGLSGALGDV